MVISANEILEKAMKYWLLEHKKLTVANKTFNSLYRKAEIYIYPSLGNLPVSKISTETVQYLLTDVLYKEMKLSFATVHKCRCLLNNFFEYCLHFQIITINPIFNTVERIENKKQSKNELEREEYLKIIDVISANRFWKPFCETVLSVKLQLKEILSLRWENIDFVNCIIKLNNSNNSKEFAVEANLIEILKMHKRLREREQRQLKNKYSYIVESDLVFGNEEGKLRSISGLSHNFRKFLRNRGVVNWNIKLHSLRDFKEKEERQLKRQLSHEALKNKKENIKHKQEKMKA